MKVKLSHEDRCAIDLVLEHRANGSVSQRCFGKPTASTRKRVKRVERVLELLAALPATEPSPTLTTATLKYIRRHEHDGVAAVSSASRPATVSHSMFNRPLQ
jgi:hypothetical protein